MITTEQARARLDAAGVPPRDVLLPGEEGLNPRQGALHVAAADTGYEIQAQEYGLAEVVARASTLDEALEYVVTRVTRALPAPRPWDSAKLQRPRELFQQIDQQVRSLVASQPGANPVFDLYDGLVVDRFGALDGFLLWPEGTPFAHRAQPPDTLDPSLPDQGYSIFGVAAPVKVRARITAPWFGQPGGALCLKIDAPRTTVRDLVQSGALIRLDVQKP